MSNFITTKFVLAIFVRVCTYKKVI